jgi:hypothetical protein
VYMCLSAHVPHSTPEADDATLGLFRRLKLFLALLSAGLNISTSGPLGRMRLARQPGSGFRIQGLGFRV